MSRKTITDYQDFTTIDTPKAERRRLDVGDVWANQVQCLSCGELVRSKNRHDLVFCSCGKAGVDGGSWYGRYIGEPDNMESAVILFNDV